MALIRSIVDSTITTIGRGIAKRLFHTMGDVTDFSFDSGRREVTMTIVFNGEEDTTSVVLGDYSVRENDGIVQLQFGRVTVSKPWLNAAAQKFFVGRYIDVPEDIALEIKAIFGDRDGK